MVQRIKGSARWLLVTVGVILLTSFTVDATLSNSLSQSALGILAKKATESGCPEGMQEVQRPAGAFCVDTYEVSPATSCPATEVRSIIDTQLNNDSAACMPVSRPDAAPWVFVSQHQAQELCAKSGKRLPTNEEWYRAALGTPDPEHGEVCNTDSNHPQKTGKYEACKTSSGVYDMVGNVWEWIDASVDNGEYNTHRLPESGFVINADESGVAFETDVDPDLSYHGDYFWSAEEGQFAMLRGGFYAGGSEAGIYSIQAKTAPSFQGGGVGFRCVRDI